MFLPSSRVVLKRILITSHLKPAILVKPETHYIFDLFENFRIVIVEIRLLLKTGADTTRPSVRLFQVPPSPSIVRWSTVFALPPVIVVPVLDDPACFYKPGMLVKCD